MKSQFMHNGGIAEWERIKRMLQKDLPDVAFNMVQGNTGSTPMFSGLHHTYTCFSDSEWAFALFLSKVCSRSPCFSLV
jgi:glutamine amidotransferase